MIQDNEIYVYIFDGLYYYSFFEGDYFINLVDLKS